MYIAPSSLVVERWSMRKRIETSKHCKRQSSTLLFCTYFVLIIIISRMHICSEVHKWMLKTEAIFQGIESWGHFGLMGFDTEDIELNKWVSDSHWD